MTPKYEMVAAVTAASYLLRAQQPSPPQKMITITLPEGAWNQIITILDDAPIEGAVRKPLINAIVDQARKQLADSTSITPKHKH